MVEGVKGKMGKREGQYGTACSLNIGTVGKGRRLLSVQPGGLKAEHMPSGCVVFLFIQFVLKKTGGW